MWFAFEAALPKRGMGEGVFTKNIACLMFGGRQGFTDNLAFLMSRKTRVYNKPYIFILEEMRGLQKKHLRLWMFGGGHGFTKDFAFLMLRTLVCTSGQDGIWESG